MTLRGLIEAVSEGTFLMDVLSPEHELTAYDAFSGSIDAAKALHDALLPGWEWACGWHDGGYIAGVAKDRLHDSTNVCQDQPNPARAWLLSILRALEGEP